MPNTPTNGGTSESVTRLYEVFKPYRLGEFDSCSHCVAPEEHERLASNPLRSLEASDLNRYAQKAMTTWGSVNDFKHFLPRLLELTLDHYLKFTMPEVLLSKLDYAEWSEWPPVERDAVRRFLEAFWHHQLATPLDSPRDDRMVTVLGGLAEGRGAWQSTWRSGSRHES